MSCFEDSDKFDVGDLCKDYRTDNAEQFCQRIKKRTVELKGDIEFIKNLDKFMSDDIKPEDKADILKYFNKTLKLEIPENKIVTKTNGDDCDKIGGGSVLQLNNITNDISNCNDQIKDFIKTLPAESKNRTDLEEFINNTVLTLDNVTQENVAKITKICTNNKLTTLLQGSKPTVDKLAFDDMVKELKGITIPDCSEQSTQGSGCNYIRAKVCCESIIGVNQINILDARCSRGSIKNALQKNNVEIYSSCLTGKKEKYKPEGTDVPVEKYNSVVDNAKSGNADYKNIFNKTLYVLWVINFLILCLIFLVKKESYYIVIISNFMISLVILSSILYIYTVKNPPIVYDNTDFSLCQGVIAMKEQDNLTYEDSLVVMREKEYTGFVIKEGGVVSYLTKDFDVNTDCGKKDKFKNIENVKSVLSPLQLIPSHDKIHLYVAIVCTVLCVVAITVFKINKIK
jgi:hypothetical protein